MAGRASRNPNPGPLHGDASKLTFRKFCPRASYKIGRVVDPLPGELMIRLLLATDTALGYNIHHGAGSGELIGSVKDVAYAVFERKW